ncbi:GIY-YIG nuclease family protein [Streptomyces scabiei]|nr:GIY-YIG nuclease family protein [Streptomyces sp. LBUM 1480]
MPTAPQKTPRPLPPPQHPLPARHPLGLHRPRHRRARRRPRHPRPHRRRPRIRRLAIPLATAGRIRAPVNAIPRPSAGTLSIISRFLGVLAWACQAGAAALYLGVAAQSAVWRPTLSTDPASAAAVWGGVVGLTILWGTGLHGEQVRFYNRRTRRSQRRAWAVSHIIVLLFAASSVSADDERAGLWIILAMGALASLLAWSGWMRTKELPAEDQAVIDAIHDREAQQEAAVFDASEKERRRERLSAVVASLGYQLTDTPTPPASQDEQPAMRWKIPSRKHAPLVYFIRNGNRVKIGTSTDVKRRIRTLALRPENVALLLNGDKLLERDLHKQFADLRIGNTEWFAHEGALIDYIAGQNRLARKEETQ